VVRIEETIEWWGGKEDVVREAAASLYLVEEKRGRD